MPASRSACLATHLVHAADAAPTAPRRCTGTPSSSSSSWTVPSSPPRPCSATNATSGALALQPVDEVRRRRRSAARRGRAAASASSTRAPERSETWRSSERPPLRTATFTGAPPRRAQRRRRCRSAVRARGAARGSAPGERRVQRDLLAHDLADPPHALADVVLADAGEVQPHLRAAAAVEVRRAARHERDVLAQRARRAGRWCRCSRAAAPR